MPAIESSKAKEGQDSSTGRRRSGRSGQVRGQRAQPSQTEAYPAIMSQNLAPNR